MPTDDEEQSPGAEAGAEGASPSSTTNAAEIAERIARESTEAVPRTGAGQAAPSPTAGATAEKPEQLVDRWGRTFDRALHLTKKDGTPATRGGTLITLPGKQGSGPAVKSAATSAPAGNVEEQRRLAIEAARAASGTAASDGADQGAPQSEPAPAPQLSTEEFQRRAKSGARFVRKIMARLGRWMAGDEGEYQSIDGVHEGQEIEDNTFDAQMDYQTLVPAGSLVLLLFSTGTYVGRCWGSEKHQERVDDLVARFTGKPKPKKPEQPAAKPGAGDPPPAQPSSPPATKGPGQDPVRVVPTF